MLRLMIGKAGAGKTAAIINEIKRDMASPHGRALMIVPEQYSHEAERELAQRCGDTAVPRSFSDYAITVDEAHLPAGVTCTQMGCSIRRRISCSCPACSTSNSAAGNGH